MSDMSDRCPRCATGTLVLRHGPHGDFMGCHRFPACRGNKAVGLGLAYLDRVTLDRELTVEDEGLIRSQVEPLPTEPPEDDGYPGPCTEPDYDDIMERRAERRGRSFIEP